MAMVVAQDDRGGSSSDLPKLFGKVPDVATRLTERSDANSVVISEATYRLIKDVFSCLEIGQDQAAGSGPLYQVLPDGVSASHSDAAARRVVPLVGRDEELNLLLARWDGARSGRGHVVLLSGEAGIGKTRLVRELKQRVAGDSRARVVECRCSTYRENHAFHPFLDWLDRLVRPAESDEVASDPRERLEDHLAKRGFSAEEIAPLLVPLVSLLADRPPAAIRLSPEERKEKTQQALLAMLFPRALAESVLLVVEDLHWADPSTLELLALISEPVASAKILVVLTFRSEFQPTWPLRSHMTQLSVTRLPSPDVERLIDLIAQDSPLPGQLRRQLVQRADGVPLFVEELTSMVIESHRSRARENRGQRVESERAPVIPATLRDSLMARLDRLGDAKQVAQLAAAIGREFTYELLRAVSAWNESRLQNELARLVQAELLQQRGFPPKATYWFRHTLIQETAYQSLLQRERRNCHRQIAAALQTHFSEIATTQPGLLAHHLIESGDEERAVDFLLAAGDNARALYANHEAEQNYKQAATGGFVPPGMPGHEPDLGVPYDPAEARRLLAEAGYPEGRGMPTIPWLHTHGLSGDSFIPLLCKAWQENLGVDVQVTWLDWQEFQQRTKDDPSHMMLSCWIADYPDPDNFLRVAFHSKQGLNEPRWHNHRFDELVQQAAQVTQAERRIELYHEADRILVADQVAVLPLTYGQMPLLVKPWVTRFPLGASYLRHLKDVVIERDCQAK